MTRYAWTRLAGLVPLFFAVTFLTFAVVRLSPGEPAKLEQDSPLQLTAQARAKMAELYGLDKPLLTQYAEWLSRLARLDFGNSFTDGEPAVRKILRALPVTVGFNALTLVLAFWIGSQAGLWSAWHAGSRPEKAFSAFCLAMLSVPGFWLALVLIAVFGVFLGWLPVTGLQSLFAQERPPLWRVFDVARHLVLPVAASTFGMVAVVSRYARGAFLDACHEPYVRAGRAWGLFEKDIRSRIVRPNGLLPLITLIGLSVPAIIGGSVIFESIFSIPGMGRLFYQAVFQRDYPVILGILTLGSVLTLLGNFLADVGCALADPRVRSGLKR